MDGGQGHAPAYYGQPLYPYVLALAHWLTGESLFGPLALQFAALGGVVALTGGARVAGIRQSRRRRWRRSRYVWLFVVVQPEHVRVARQLFNENLYMPLVMASLIALVWLARRPAPPTWWKAALVGMLLGITAITRSQFLAFVPLALLVLASGVATYGAGAAAGHRGRRGHQHRARHGPQLGGFGRVRADQR